METYDVDCLHIDSEGQAGCATIALETDQETWRWNGDELHVTRCTVLRGWGELDGPAVVVGIDGAQWEMALPLAWFESA